MKNITKNKGGRKSKCPADFEEVYQNAESIVELSKKYNVHKDTICAWQKKVKNKRTWKRGRPLKFDKSTVEMVRSLRKEKLTLKAIAEKMKLSERTVYFFIYNC